MAEVAIERVRLIYLGWVIVVDRLSQILMAKKINPTDMRVMPMMMLVCMEASSKIRRKSPALW